MPLTDFQKSFKKALLNITDNIEFIYAHYLSARTDEHRQNIIDNINSGKFKTKDDIRNYTKRLSPVWQILNKKGLTK